LIAPQDHAPGPLPFRSAFPPPRQFRISNARANLSPAAHLQRRFETPVSARHRRPELRWLLFFARRRRHTSSKRDWSSDVCSSDLWGETQTDGGFLADPERGNNGRIDFFFPIQRYVGLDLDIIQPSGSFIRKLDRHLDRRGAGDRIIELLCLHQQPPDLARPKLELHKSYVESLDLPRAPPLVRSIARSAHGV